MAIFDPLWSCLQLFHFWAIKFYYLVIAISTQIGIYLGTYHEQLILANSNVSNFTKEWVITLKHTRSFIYLCNVYIKIAKYDSSLCHWLQFGIHQTNYLIWRLLFSINLNFSLHFCNIYIKIWVVISKNFLVLLLFVFLVILLSWKYFILCNNYNTKRNSKMLLLIISLCVWLN